jgi:hypothetical protein
LRRRLRKKLSKRKSDFFKMVVENRPRVLILDWGLGDPKSEFAKGLRKHESYAPIFQRCDVTSHAGIPEEIDDGIEAIAAHGFDERAIECLRSRSGDARIFVHITDLMLLNILERKYTGVDNVSIVWKYEEVNQGVLDYFGLTD